MGSQASWLGLNQSDLNNILPIIGGIAGAIPATANTKTSGTSTVNSNQNTDINTLLNTLANLSASSSTNTGYGPQGNQLISSMLPAAMGQINNATNLAPYEASQISQINNNSNLQQKAVDNIMAARGVASSPVAATADANVQNQRFSNITGLQEQIPLLQNQLTNQNLSTAGNVLNELPKTQMGTSAQQQNTAQTGNTQSNTIANQNTTQNQTTKSTSGGGIGGFLGGLGSTLASLFA